MSHLTVRDVDLQYEIAGEGPTFVWGHGLTSSRAHEDQFGLLDWPRLGQRNTVVRYDARGHGDSGSTAEAAGYHWRELALDQLALADALGIERYIAGGASMGCATALHAATIAPDRISALVLAIPPTAWATRAAQQQNYEIGARLVETGQLDLLIEGGRSTPSPDPLADAPQRSESFEQLIRSTDPLRLARIFRGAAGPTFPSPTPSPG